MMLAVPLAKSTPSKCNPYPHKYSLDALQWLIEREDLASQKDRCKQQYWRRPSMTTALDCHNNESWKRTFNDISCPPSQRCIKQM